MAVAAPASAELARRLQAAIPSTPAPDEAARLAVGRPRELATDLLAGLATAEQPEPWLRPRLRDLRRLRSRQRRLAQDALFAAIRHRPLIAALTDPSPDSLWTGGLVLAGGLEAEAELAPLVEAEALVAFTASMAPEQVLALVGGLPPWLVDRLVAQRGLDEAVDLTIALLGRAPTTLRANTDRCTRPALAAALEREGVATLSTAHAPHGLHLVGTANLPQLRCFKNGWFEVQDEASQLAALLVSPAPGLVVDLCCGAGGKALALPLHPGAELLGFDVRGGALQTAEKRARRAGRRLKVRKLPRGEAPDLPPRSASRVLVDAPCTGTGTLRRTPARRWSLHPDELHAATALQAELLDTAAELVAPSGELVYATCSLLAEENEAQVAALLDRHPRFQRSDPTPLLGPNAQELQRGGALDMDPARHGSDGFFACVLVASPA